MNNAYKKLLEIGKRYHLLNKFDRILSPGSVNGKNKKLSEELKNKVIELTNFLPIDTKYSYRQNLLRLIPNTEKEWQCPVCSRPRKLSATGNKFEITCGTKDQIHKETIKKIQYQNQQNSRKTSGKDYSRSPESQSKFEVTCLKKFGAKTPLTSKKIQEKSRKTLIKKYGVENAHQNPKVIEKAKKTCLAKYGVDNPMKNEIIQKKAISTNLKRYGGNGPACSKSVKEKQKKTLLKNYGEDNPAKIKKFKRKRELTRLKNFTTLTEIDSLKFKPENILNFREEINKELICNNYIDKNNCLLVQKLTKDLGYRTNTPTYNIVKNFGIKYNHRQGQSEPEYQIIDLLELAVPEIEIVHGSRKIIAPLELDIYLPEYQLAIEFNGSLYHSAGKDNWSAVNNTLEEMQNKHSTKTKACQDKGIELIHIPEWWWNYDREYWERLVLSKIGVGELQKSSELSSSYELLGSNHPVILPELYSPLEWTQETLEQLIEEGKRVYFL